MRFVLGGLWLLFVALSAGSGVVFLQGVLRDTRAGEPEIALDLATASPWLEQGFRVWRAGRYELFLSSVNHTPPFDTPYGGGLHVRVVDPSGRAVWDERYAPGSLDHRRPDNMAWTPVGTLELEGTWSRPWTLAVQVPEGDTRFAGVRSALHLRRVRADPGMGGMVNYVMIIPALGFALLSLFPALALVNQGASRALLWISGGLIAAVLGVLAYRP